MAKIGTLKKAGVVVLRNLRQDRLYLMLRAYDKWDFPKGEIDPGESPLAAAIREAKEEAMLGDLVFQWGEVFCETPVYSRGVIARYYLAITNTSQIVLPVSAELGRPEHHEFRWLTFVQAMGLAPPRLKPILAWADKLVRAHGP